MSTVSNVPKGEAEQKIAHTVRYMRQRRYSDSTVRTYVSFVRQFFTYINWNDWNRVVAHNVIDYNYVHFIQKGRATSTQNQAIIAIKLFYRLHARSELVPESIMRPRRERRLPRVLSQAEFGRIINNAGNLKHHTLLTVVYGASLRIGEAWRLPLKDMRCTERLFYISRSKGRKDWCVPLSSTLLEYLERATTARIDPGSLSLRVHEGASIVPAMPGRCCSGWSDDQRYNGK